MTMTLDNQQRFPLNFDHMASYSSSQPQFTNPWSSATAGPSHTATSHSMYMGSQGGMGSHMGLDSMKHQQQHQGQQSHHSSSRTGTSSSMASFGSIPVTAASAGSPLNLMSMPRLPHTSGAGYTDAAYSAAAPSPIQPSYSTSSSSYDQLGYTAAPMRSTFATAMDTDQRRYSQPSVPSILPDPEQQIRQPSHRNSLVDMSTYRGLHNDDRRSFADAIEASHGILSLSQETPRPIYGTRTRGSEESYGFPTTHSTSSSVSSQGFSPYYGGSIDSSVSDYSTAGSDIESGASRTLPRPQGLMGGAPPAPQSMMGSFSSKVSSTTQKKHKCKVCDKRFTRPSSLQTHMYSHTGEKPFQCEVGGCGRHFSVVSNLRRHRKVHKGQTPSEADSEDHDHDDHHSD